MKNKFLNLGSVVLLVAVVFSSCMKDKNYNNGIDGINYVPDQQKVVGIELSNPDTSNFIITAFDANPAVTEFDLAPIELAGGVPATQDVHVVLAIDSNLVNTYNTVNGQTYLNPLPSTFTTSSLTLTIPKGQTKATLKLDLIPANFLGAIYAIGVRIVSVDGGYQVAAGYKSHGILAFGVKNQYDGQYQILSGHVQRYTSPGTPDVGAATIGYSGSLVGDPNIYLTTTGVNSVSIPSAGPGALPWAAGSGVTVAGIDPLSIVIDPVTHLITATSQQNATLMNWAGHDNYYDPATKTVHLSMRWNPTANVREYEVVMQYVGPRP